MRETKTARRARRRAALKRAVREALREAQQQAQQQQQPSAELSYNYTQMNLARVVAAVRRSDDPEKLRRTLSALDRAFFAAAGMAPDASTAAWLPWLHYHVLLMVLTIHEHVDVD